MLRDRLRGMGREADLQTVPIRPRFGLAHTVHALLAVVGSVVAVTNPEVGGALVLAAALATFLDVTNVLQLTRRLTGRRMSQNVESIERLRQARHPGAGGPLRRGAGRAGVRLRHPGPARSVAGDARRDGRADRVLRGPGPRGRRRGAHGRTVRAHRRSDPARARARRHRAVGGLSRRGRQRRRGRRRARPRRRAGRTPGALRPVGGPHRRAAALRPGHVGLAAKAAQGARPRAHGGGQRARRRSRPGDLRPAARGR